jgi:dihydrofolate reductase
MICLIAAFDLRQVIGTTEGRMPWGLSLKSDLKRFRQLTLNHKVIMGRKTFQSIGRPLPNRHNLVITGDTNFKAQGCEVVHSVDEALSRISETETAFVIGGGEIYSQSMPYAKRLFITRIMHAFEGNVYFPDIDPRLWRMDSDYEVHFITETNPYQFRLETWERIA